MSPAALSAYYNSGFAVGEQENQVLVCLKESQFVQMAILQELRNIVSMMKQASGGRSNSDGTAQSQGSRHDGTSSRNANSGSAGANSGSAGANSSASQGDQDMKNGGDNDSDRNQHNQVVKVADGNKMDDDVSSGKGVQGDPSPEKKPQNGENGGDSSGNRNKLMTDI
jgi:hypothetical protein